MEVILPFGNLLNRGTAKGSAKGVKLEELVRIAHVKAVSNSKISGLFYIVSHLDKGTDEMRKLLDIPYEMYDAIMDATKVDADTLAKTLKEVRMRGTAAVC